jgi:hypothetical protein
MELINETIQEVLQLPVVGKKRIALANGNPAECDHVFPLEQMDVLIDPVRQRLIVNPAHPDYAVLKIRTAFRTSEFDRPGKYTHENTPIKIHP